MSNEAESAITSLAAELEASPSWWRGTPQVSVADFGYPEVSILVAAPHVAINLPGKAAAHAGGQPFRSSPCHRFGRHDGDFVGRRTRAGNPVRRSVGPTAEPRHHRR